MILFLLDDSVNFKVLVVTILKPSTSTLTLFHVSERIMKSKLLIMLKQSVFRNFSPNDFEDLLYKLECFIEISTTEKNRIWYT